MMVDGLVAVSTSTGKALEANCCSVAHRGSVRIREGDSNGQADVLEPSGVDEGSAHSVQHSASCEQARSERAMKLTWSAGEGTV